MRLVLTVGAAVAASIHLWRLWFLRVRYLDLDELEHLHGAWSISKGLLPYRDYFEHHTPAFHFLLAPFFRSFAVETKPSDAIAFIFFARGLMWVLTGVILLLVFHVAARWRDRQTGWLAVFCVSIVVMFVEKSLEVRPDVLAVAFWLAALACALAGVQSSSPRKASFAWSGVFLGLGLLTTQKLLFALPGFGGAMLWYLLDPASPTDRRTRSRLLIIQAVALATPLVAVGLYFWARHGLAELIEYNLLFNLRYKYRLPVGGYLAQLVTQNPFTVALGLAGLARGVLRLRHTDSRRRGDPLLLFSTGGLLLGLFVIPVPYRQYYLLFLPLLGILAGAAFLELVPTLRSSPVLWACVMAPAAIIAGREMHGPILAVWLVGLAGSLGLLYLRKWPSAASALLLLTVAIHPAQQLRAASQPMWWNTRELEEIRFVLRNTKPTDTVMGGWMAGRAVFRPHAYFFWFFSTEELLVMLSEAHRRELLAQLRAGTIAPKLILFDEILRNISPDITAFFEERYEPTGMRYIWRRKADGAPRHPAGPQRA